MNRREAYEDISFLLLLVPFFLSGVYAIFLWASLGVSAFLPEQAFLGVTRSPSVFLVGAFAVMLGVVIEIANLDAGKKVDGVSSLSKRLQGLAATSFILAIISAWYANGFSLDLSGTASDLFLGKYAIVFPALLVLLSFLIASPLRLGRIAQPEVLAVILLLAVPAVVYEVGKRSSAVGLLGALVLIISAGLLLIRKGSPTTV